VKRSPVARLLPLALLGGLALPAAPARADQGSGPKPDARAAASSPSPDLIANRKILEATVAGLAKPASGEPAGAADAGDTSAGERRGSHRLTLPALWELAEQRYPGLQAGRDSVRSARFTRDEQKWLRLPSGDFSAYLSWSPKVNCTMTTGNACTQTDGNLNFNNDDLTNYLPKYGALVHIDLSLRQPLYTFGKLDAALKLGDVGVSMAQASAEGARADLAVNLSRAYFGVKAARAARDTLQEGRDQLVKWIKQIDKDLEAGKTNYTEIDLTRLKYAEAAIQIQLSEANRLASSALAALRFLSQDAEADVDDEELQVSAREEHDLPYYLDEALRYRPELRALTATGEGARLYKKLRIAELLPNFGIVANLSYGYAGGIQDPANAFQLHFNYLALGLGLGMQWSLDFGPRVARLQKAISDLHLFEARKREALGAGALDIERQYHDLHEAQQRLAAAEVAERRARGWLQGVQQNIDIGTGESRDMVEALRAYFEQRIIVLRSINDVNVQAAVLRRLCGLEVIAK
jgi:outer membrane protein TolC